MTGQSDIQEKVALEAIEWLIELSEHTDDETLRQNWQAWLDQDPQHQLAWQKIQQVNQQLEPINNPEAASVIHRSLLTNQQERRQILRSMVGIAFISSTGLALYKSDALQVLAADYHTGKGETKSLTLADNTFLEMNADTMLSVDYSSEQRRVVLMKGDVIITTAKEPRPFILDSGWAQLKPIGTRFYVRHRDTVSFLAVYDGAVNLFQEGQSTPLRVSKGEKVVWESGQLSNLLPAQAADLAWKQHMLIADKLPLNEVLNELMIYHRGWIKAEPALQDRFISGTYPLDNKDSVLKAIASTLSADLIYRTRYWITLREQQK